MKSVNEKRFSRHGFLRAEIRPEPDLFDHAREREQQQLPAVRWIMRRYGVPASIAQLYALHSGTGGLHNG